MKVLTEERATKVLELLDAQNALYSKQFREAHDNALVQSAVGMGSGFSTAAGMIRKAMNDGEYFNETRLEMVKAFADSEMGKVGYYTDVDPVTEIYWRNEAAALMVAYNLIAGYMTEPAEDPISKKEDEIGTLGDVGQQVVEDFLKTCENREWDKMDACKKAGKDVSPVDKGRAYGFHKALEYVHMYRNNVHDAMKGMQTQINMWKKNTHPAPFDHQAMLASADAMQEAVDLVNIYYTELASADVEG